MCIMYIAQCTNNKVTLHWFKDEQQGLDHAAKVLPAKCVTDNEISSGLDFNPADFETKAKGQRSKLEPRDSENRCKTAAVSGCEKPRNFYGCLVIFRFPE